MRKIAVVAWREFLVTVRTRAFILMTLLMPALMVGGVYASKHVQQMTAQEEVPERRLAVVDHTGVIFAALEAQIAQHNQENPNQTFAVEQVDPETTSLDDLKTRAQNEEIYGYIVLPADILDITSESEVKLARGDQQLNVGRRLEGFINYAVYTVRYEQAGIDAARVFQLRTPVNFEPLDAKTGEVGSRDVFARVMTPFAFMFLLFMGTFGISQGLLTSVIEEKNSRVMEVLLSAVSPLELMAGKILGTVMVGFLLLAIWGSVGTYSAQSYELDDVVSGYRLAIALIYFIPGFLLMSSLLAGIGAACNELKEAQSMVFPLSIVTVIPLLFWFFISEHPSSTFSIVLSYIPVITPFVMILRVCSDPDTPVWQILSTLAVLWAGVVVAIWAASKVFRVGVLMYGKPPTPGELLRWIRQA